MSFREVRVFEVREVLRLWLRGEGLRTVERLAGVDRKTVRRYVAAGVEAGIDRSGGEEQLTDLLIAVVVEKVRPCRSDGRGPSWRTLQGHQEKVRSWLEDDNLTVSKIHILLGREGVVVPSRTLERFCAELCGPRRGRSKTVRVADGQPGEELQVDFGRMGLMFDPQTGRRRVCQALILTASVSRHCFVWLPFRQTTQDVIDGFEAAWDFFGGIFRIVIPDNMSSVIDKANATEPRLNQAFVEYAQARGFLVDAARVRHPQDKPKVERMVTYVRNSFFAGEHFIDLADGQRRAEYWCRSIAGLRIHGTTQCRPAEHFAVCELPVLLPAPTERYDLPIYPKPKVARDHHIEVAKALYSVPGSLIGCHVDVRADRELVKIFYKGKIVKIHPRQPVGGCISDPGDLPPGKSIYALRDLDRLRQMAADHGVAIGAYAAVLLDNPLPWTKMRQVYVLLGLVKKWGPQRVEAACERAAEAEAYNVSLIGRMIERAAESEPVQSPPARSQITAARFIRPAEDFRVIPARSTTPDVADTSYKAGDANTAAVMP